MKSFRAVVLLFLVLVTACDAAAQSNQPGPTAPPSAVDAEGVARAFLEGWVKGKYMDMYGLISPLAQKVSPDNFTQTYRDVEAALRLNDKEGKAFEIKSDQTVRQGSTVVVRYNMTFDSGPLGKFTDENRTMRLILTQGRWRVSWSTMDIFEGMAAGAKLNVVLTQSQRGFIFDRNGRLIAADGIENYAVRFLTRKFPTGKAQDCYNKLAEVFRLKALDLKKSYGEFADKDYGFTVGTLSAEDYTRLKPELDAVCLLQYVPQQTRYYYSGSFAAQTIGYMGQVQKEDAVRYAGVPEDALVGRQGVEAYFQDQLAGRSGAQLLLLASDGTLIRTIASRAPSPSQNVTVTLDRDLQAAVERAVANASSAANWGQFTTGAAAVVIDVNTGEILAMASFPTVDPDVFLPTTTFDVQDVLTQYTQQRATFNRASQETYAPGSVFKIVSTAAAANSGAFKMSDIYVCRGTWDGTQKGDQLRKDWIYLDPYVDKNYHDAITLEQALTGSCDTYYWTVGEKLNGMDASLLSKVANQMGLGIKTGVDAVIEEKEGIVPNPDWKRKTANKAWGLGDSLNIVIGQGDTQVTVLQVARMMAAVANGGTLYRPVLVKSVGEPDKPPTFSATPAPSQSTGISADVMKGVESGLCNVVTDAKIGTAQYVFYNWNFNQIVVCGKTGTAQNGTPHPNGWFVAYAGRAGGKPEIAVAVIVERSREGSETAGPIVRRIIESYYGLKQEPWPDFWSGPYVEMADPNVSDGGGLRNRQPKKP